MIKILQGIYFNIFFQHYYYKKCYWLRDSIKINIYIIVKPIIIYPPIIFHKSINSAVFSISNGVRIII